MRICTKCAKEKRGVDFYRNSPHNIAKGGAERQAACKDCMRAVSARQKPHRSAANQAIWDFGGNGRLIANITDVPDLWLD